MDKINLIDLILSAKNGLKFNARLDEEHGWINEKSIFTRTWSTESIINEWEVEWTREPIKTTHTIQEGHTLMAKLEQEIERLKTDKESWQKSYSILLETTNKEIERCRESVASQICGYCWDKMYTEGYPSENEKLNNKIEDLERKLNIAVDALEFYGDKELGTFARQALKEIKE